MRILPGAPMEFANETPTSQHLAQFLVNQPDFLPQAMTAFDRDATAFSSLLARQNKYQGKLAINPNNKGYKVVGSRKVMWHIKGNSERKITFTRDAEVINASYPGQYQTIIKVYTDTNWASPKEVLGLADDHRSQLYIATDNLPEEVGQNEWCYTTKVNTNVYEDYINPKLLKKSMEANILYTQYEELSQTAQEKYTFDESAYTYMTIQRMKWSMSGTAEALKTGVVWMEHNGVNMWATKAQMEMMARAARYRENQMLFGKSTVAPDGRIVMKTIEGFEVCAGDGLTNQGDGAWRMPYNDFSLGVMEDIMTNVRVTSGSDGPVVAAICGARQAGLFQKIMKQQAGIDPKVVEMNGTGKGINMDYDYYKWNGVKFILTVVPWFDNPNMASVVGEDGIRNFSKRMLFVNLGDASIGEPNVELLALGNRNWIEGEINGMNKGGDNMSNSVDGMSHHVLFESGAALKDIHGIGELYVPFK